MQYYSEELTLLSYTLEDGIEVMSYEIVSGNANGSPNTVTIPFAGSGSREPGTEGSNTHIHIEKMMLWIDSNVDEPALSRICLVKRSNLETYKNSLSYIQDRQQRESNSSAAQDWFVPPSRSNRKPRGYTILEEEDERLSKGNSSVFGCVLWVY